MTRKQFKLTPKEREAIQDLNPKPGDYLILVRNHPHCSKDHPFLHIDSITIFCLGVNRFKFIGKEHIPVDPSQ